MKKMLIIAACVVVAGLVLVLALTSNRNQDTNKAPSNDLNSYTKQTPADSPAGENTGGSGTDTVPSSDGTGPGPEDDLLSQ